MNRTVNMIPRLLPMLLLLAASPAGAQGFYPLAPGNAWTYTLRHISPGASDSEAVRCTVTSDTLLGDGRRYAQLDMPDILGGKLVSADAQYVYYRSDPDSPAVPLFNLTAPEGHVDTLSWGSYMTSAVAGVDTAIVFGKDVSRRRYRLDGLAVLEVTLAEGFGVVSALDWGDGCLFPCQDWTLRGCRINDTLYGVTTVVAGQHEPAAFALFQNYPNPFNPTTTISYSLARTAFVEISVSNILGERVATLTFGTQSAGTHQALFDGSRLATGVYIIALVSEKTVLRQLSSLIR